MPVKKISLPSTNFSLVQDWFARAARHASARGANNSAQLWMDGLEHLNALKALNEEAVAILEAIESRAKANLPIFSKVCTVRGRLQRFLTQARKVH